MEPIALSFSAALVMGLIFGAGPCNITCLPYLGPVLLGQEGGVRRSWRLVLPFSGGRLAGYGMLGAVAGGAGYGVTELLDTGAAAVALGAATVVAGLLLIRRAGRASCMRGASDSERPVQWHEPRGRGAIPATLFGLGAAMALNPCIPLGTVLLAASATADPVEGACLGLGFGLGAIALPSFIFALLVSYFGAQIRLQLGRWQRALERGMGGMLIVLGAITALGWVQP